MNEKMDDLLGVLERSQWCSKKELLAKQNNKFRALVLHAYQSVPFYQKFYAPLVKQGELPQLDISEYPVLFRAQLQEKPENHYLSSNLPSLHGQLNEQETSGSTGAPIKIVGTDFTRLFYDAIMLREHSWRRRDLQKKLLAIRWAERGFAEAPNVCMQATWGPPVNQYRETGSSIFMNIVSSTQSQIDVLLLHQPSYLLSYPSQLAALAEYCVRHGIAMPFLEELRTTGETFTESYTFIIRKAWPQIKITDVYSSAEIGFMAQPCFEQNNYHVNIESILLEIVDEDNQPCAIGQSGRVLVTNLLNYAQPLIRYEIGDYAEWGEPCACGRGLPVLKRILGRKRNRLALPSGESIFPYLGEISKARKITESVRKFQIIQHTVNHIELKLIVVKPLSLAEEEKLKSFLQMNLGFPFDVTISYHEQIPAGPSGKYEEFISYAAQ